MPSSINFGTSGTAIGRKAAISACDDSRMVQSRRTKVLETKMLEKSRRSHRCYHALVPFSHSTPSRLIIVLMLGGNDYMSMGGNGRVGRPSVLGDPFDKLPSLPPESKNTERFKDEVEISRELLIANSFGTQLVRNDLAPFVSFYSKTFSKKLFDINNNGRTKGTGRAGRGWETGVERN